MFKFDVVTIQTMFSNAFCWWNIFCFIFSMQYYSICVCLINANWTLNDGLVSDKHYLLLSAEFTNRTCMLHSMLKWVGLNSTNVWIRWRPLRKTVEMKVSSSPNTKQLRSKIVFFMLRMFSRSCAQYNYDSGRCKTISFPVWMCFHSCIFNVLLLYAGHRPLHQSSGEWSLQPPFPRHASARYSLDGRHDDVPLSCRARRDLHLPLQGRPSRYLLVPLPFGLHLHHGHPGGIYCAAQSQQARL